MAIVGAATQPKPVFLEYDALADVGTGALISLSGQGFSAATQGFTAGPFLSMPYGAQVLVRDLTTSYLFVVAEGTGGKVAVLVATLSAGAAATISGATLKYVVYPTAFLLPPTGVFTTIAAAITQANTENAANSVCIIIAPGAYTESITVRNQMSLVGLGTHDETGNSGVRLTGDNVTPAITVPESTVCSIENMRVDGNTQSAVSFANVAGATRFQTEGCTFVSTATNTIDGSGASSVVTAVMTNTQVTGNVVLTQAAGVATLRGCDVTGKVDGLTVSMNDSTFGSSTTAGTATVRGCVGDSMAAGVAVMSDTTMTGSVAGGVGSSLRRCAIRNIVLTGAGASVVDTCTVNSSSSPATVGISTGAGHTVTIISTDVTTDGATNALGGAGSAIIYGGLPGTGLIDSAMASVTAVSGHAVLLEVDVTPVASPTTNAWPASNPDRVRFTPFDTTAANSVLQLPASNTQVPGRELLVRNVSSVNFGQLQATGGDSLFDGTTNGPINLPPSDYRRLICRRGVGWEVN